MRPIAPQCKSAVFRSKLEERYAQHLEGLLARGEILGFRYEAVQLRLGDGATYKPDFFVTYPDRMEFHEVKGFRREASIVRFKVAKELYWQFGFVMVTWRKDEETWFLQ